MPVQAEGGPRQLPRPSRPPPVPVKKLAIVATISKQPGDTGHARSLNPLRALAQEPDVSVHIAADNVFPDIPTDTAGICILHHARLAGESGIELSRKLMAKNYIIVSACDTSPDPFAFTPDGNEFFAFRGVHAIQTSTKPLGDILRLQNPEVAFFPDSVPALPPVANFADPNRRTVFFGPLDQAQGAEPLLATLLPALNGVAAALGERLNFCIVNDREFFDALNTPHKSFVPGCNHETYLHLLGRSEIAFLPLSDTVSNRLKSDLEFVEASACRVACLASPVVYGASITDLHTGLLFRNAEELVQRLAWLVVNPGAMALADAARAWVANHRMLGSQTKARVVWYRSLMARRTELTHALRARVPELAAASRPGFRPESKQNADALEFAANTHQTSFVVPGSPPPGATLACAAEPLHVHRRHAASITHAMDADRHVEEIARRHAVSGRPESAHAADLPEPLAELAGKPASASARRPHLLFVAESIPKPDQDSGSADHFNYMKVFLELGFDVTFLNLGPPLEEERYRTALETIGVRLPVLPDAKTRAAWVSNHGHQLSAVFITKVNVAIACLDLIKLCAPRAKIMFFTGDLHFLREQRKAILQNSKHTAMSAADLKQRELQIITSSDATIVVSPVEVAILADLAPKARVYLIPVFREIPGRSALFHDRQGLVFIGGFRHPPNADAIFYFLKDIWHLVRMKIPGVKLHIVGSNMPRALAELAMEDVVVHGHVVDLQDVFGRCRVSIAPLRYGAGQKGKLVTSLSHGVPVIATRVAVEGMHFHDDSVVRVGDTPESFAQAVAETYLQETEWQRMSDGGLAHVRAHFAYDVAKQAIRTMTDEVLATDLSTVALHQE
jgi:glycosyltransferase involved in cell wall biosynthesis